MLILVGVTINVALNGGLFQKAKSAADGTQKQAEKEELMVAAFGTVDTKGDLNVKKSSLEKNLSNGWIVDNGAITDSNNQVWYKCTSPKGNIYYLNRATGGIREEVPTVGGTASITIPEDEDGVGLSTTYASYRSKILSVNIENLQESQLEWELEEGSCLTLIPNGRTATVTAPTETAQTATGKLETIIVSANGVEPVEFTICINPWLYFGLTGGVEFDTIYTGTFTENTMRFNSDGSIFVSFDDKETRMSFIDIVEIIVISNSADIIDNSIFIIYNDTNNDSVFDSYLAFYYEEVEENNETIGQIRFYMGEEVNLTSIGITAENLQTPEKRAAVKALLTPATPAGGVYRKNS